MTVRVIGESPKAIKNATCTNCAAILEYTLNDTYVKTVSDYGGGSDTYRILVCPRCQDKINVELY